MFQHAPPSGPPLADASAGGLARHFDDGATYLGPGHAHNGPNPFPLAGLLPAVSSAGVGAGGSPYYTFPASEGPGPVLHYAACHPSQQVRARFERRAAARAAGRLDSPGAFSFQTNLYAAYPGGDGGSGLAHPYHGSLSPATDYYPVFDQDGPAYPPPLSHGGASPVHPSPAGHAYPVSAAAGRGGPNPLSRVRPTCVLLLAGRRLARSGGPLPVRRRRVEAGPRVRRVRLARRLLVRENFRLPFRRIHPELTVLSFSRASPPPSHASPLPAVNGFALPPMTPSGFSVHPEADLLLTGETSARSGLSRRLPRCSS